MEEHNILCIANRSEFRAWLEAHHASERECWVDVKRGRPVDDKHFWYLDAVEEALCFGWIDSRHKLIDGKRIQCDSSGLNVPPISLSNVPGISE